MDPVELGRRLASLEERLARLEEAIAGLAQSLARTGPVSLQTAEASIKQWVTDFVSLRLQQLVPGACEHAPAPAGGPYLGGTDIRCTEDVARRVARIPIPFVREMVVQKVVQRAKAEGVAHVDIAFFERAAIF